MSVELVFQVLGIVISVIAGFWAVAKIILWQFNSALDKRFETLEEARKEGRRALDERFRRMEGKQDETEKDVRRILTELPREYVRREDYVRSQSVIEGKLDSLALRIENALLKGGRND